MISSDSHDSPLHSTRRTHSMKCGSCSSIKTWNYFAMLFADSNREKQIPPNLNTHQRFVIESNSNFSDYQCWPRQTNKKNKNPIFVFIRKSISISLVTDLDASRRLRHNHSTSKWSHRKNHDLGFGEVHKRADIKGSIEPELCFMCVRLRFSDEILREKVSQRRWNLDVILTVT